jgi:catechol 2,3-dioxygenase-like lactoylglutathione lyase family enzyme
MTQGVRISSAVMFVRELDRSVRFYEEVLSLEVTDRDSTAALLTSPNGGQLILRSMGEHAPHALGSVGVQYVVWDTASRDDLDACEQALRRHSAHRVTRHIEGLTAVEGSDPDGIVVFIIYPGHEQQPLRSLPTRIYAW